MNFEVKNMLMMERIACLPSVLLHKINLNSLWCWTLPRQTGNVVLAIVFTGLKYHLMCFL